MGLPSCVPASTTPSQHTEPAQTVVVVVIAQPVPVASNLVAAVASLYLTVLQCRSEAMACAGAGASIQHSCCQGLQGSAALALRGAGFSHAISVRYKGSLCVSTRRESPQRRRL